MTGLVPIFAAKPEGTATVEIDVDIVDDPTADAFQYRHADFEVWYDSALEEEDVD